MSESDGGFAIEGCKARALAFDKYFVGTLKQDSSSFIHVTLKILSGRSQEIKKMLSDKIMIYILKFVSELKLDSKYCDVSVDIADMERETYSKNRINS